MAVIVGISYGADSTKKSGTLYFTDAFSDYENNRDAGRISEGVKACSQWSGDVDISSVHVGDTVELYYAPSVVSKDGRKFDILKKVEVVSKAHGSNSIGSNTSGSGTKIN